MEHSRFEAICEADIVICGGLVIKNRWGNTGRVEALRDKFPEGAKILEIPVDVPAPKPELVRLEGADLYTAAQEIQDFFDWVDVKKFAEDLCGANARYVTIETDSEYDDEGGYYPVIGDVTFYGEDEKPCLPDFTTEFWRERLDGVPFDPEEEDPRDLLSEAIYDVRSDYDLPHQSRTWYLDRPPSQKYVAFYAERKV